MFQILVRIYEIFENQKSLLKIWDIDLNILNTFIWKYVKKLVYFFHLENTRISSGLGILSKSFKLLDCYERIKFIDITNIKNI